MRPGRPALALRLGEPLGGGEALGVKLHIGTEQRAPVPCTLETEQPPGLGEEPAQRRAAGVDERKSTRPADAATACHPGVDGADVPAGAIVAERLDRRGAAGVMDARRRLVLEAVSGLLQPPRDID